MREATGDLCPAGLRLLGFHNRDRLKPYHNLDIAYFAEPHGSMAKTPPLAAPELGRCTSSERACRLRAALRSQGADCCALGTPLALGALAWVL